MIALREVEGMAHPAYPAQPHQFLWLAIPEICPPGEGVVRQIDKIFWRQAAFLITALRTTLTSGNSGS